MIVRMSLAAAAFTAMAGMASAEFTKVNDQDVFMDLVTGKELTRPFVNLTVTPDGRIEGTGVTWPVTGEWTWQDGYFCRSLNWGGDDLGYNCQEVRSNGERMRFTSDQGAGESAVFSLR